MSAVQAIANRRRQRALLMQAELDGRDLVETPRKAKPASLRPYALGPVLPPCRGYLMRAKQGCGACMVHADLRLASTTCKRAVGSA
jgi:hypothetical protein